MKKVISLFASAALLPVISVNLASAAPATIKIDGSSTVFPITEAVAEEFQTSKKGAVRVTVGISGTGGGFKKFCRGEIDVQDASRPISKEEMSICQAAGIKYFELPIAFDALVVAVNKNNTWVKDISIDDLKKMWAPEAQGKIVKWNQVKSDWPDSKLSLFGAGSDSGTFDYFTEAVVGKAKASRGDYTSSEDDNTLVLGIANDKNAIGYLPYSYYSQNMGKLKALAIIGGAKAPVKKGVLPSKEAVENGSYFPLSRPLFIYVNAAAMKRPEVKEFVTFYINNGGELAAQVKYVSLPVKSVPSILDNLNKGKVGTVFGGENVVGLKIEDLLKREAKH